MGLFIFFAPFGGNKVSPDQTAISDTAWKAAFYRKFQLHKSMKQQQGKEQSCV